MRPGQALVVVLLILGIAVTVGLSVISRSITEINVSTTENESVKALEAAEAGVERALAGVVVAGPNTQAVGNTDATFQITSSGVGGTNTYEVPFLIDNGNVATVDLNGYAPGNIRLCWGRGSDNPAVEVMVYYSQGSNIAVGRNGFDASGRANFTGGVQNGNCSGLNYKYSRLITFASDLGVPAGGTPRILRVRALYTGSAMPIAVVSSGGNIPVQGKDLISTGQSGQSTQKLHVIQANADLPAMFDAAIYSGNSLDQ